MDSKKKHLFGILCMALALPAYFVSANFFIYIAIHSYISTLIWTFVYFLCIRETLTLAINWILTEFVITGIVTILYTIAFILMLASATGYIGAGTYIAAGVFGLFNTLAYLAGCYLLWIEHRDNHKV